MGHDVFISHSSKDKAAADAVCAALEANGVRCGIAPRDIKAGEKWATSILRGIAECRVMVLVFSTHTNGSEHICREVERAVHRGIPIAPLRIADAIPQGELEYFLSSSHWMDALTAPLEKHLREFALTVRALLEVGGKPSAATPDPAAATTGHPAPAMLAEKSSPALRTPRSRRIRIAALGVALLLAGATAAGWAFRGELARRFTAATPSAPAPVAPSQTSGGNVANLPGPAEANNAKNFTNTLGMKFVRIEPGTFMMGSPSSEPGCNSNETRHQVTLSRPFMIAATHVTRGQFLVFTAETGYKTEDGNTPWENVGFDQTDAHPVVYVNWNDAVAFCKWLSAKEHKRYRLPTEAEWEYACRAGTQTAYFWGDDLDKGQGYVNCSDLTRKEQDKNMKATEEPFNWHDGFVYTSPVGSFKPNQFGLYDMIGNAEEWCSDYYAPYPPGDAVDPTGPSVGDKDASRVLRGASWAHNPPYCRTAHRGWHAPGYRYRDIGFRLCLDF